MTYLPVTQAELDTALEKVECACGVKVANVFRRAIWQLKQNQCRCGDDEPEGAACPIEPGGCSE